ncbi:hypothetical protein V496_04272 [Pseudogymnoascus sp. VKM F-4515 (FW-2607)]|nr:hypothetical protein V496_04272 [Pseudogymnoascus sp. VKM F-4515 (FW-2607)]
MAYTDDAVLAKLSALNETQESIVTVAQWVMFHRRHADRTGQLWLQRLKDSNSNKRLNLVYLANEVAQQSKARKKDDFLIAFSPVIAEATATAYKGATNDVQQKLRRVVEVWRQRQIFETPIQDSIESRIDELDKNKSSGKRGFGDGGIFSKGGASVPTELVPLVAPQQAITKLTAPTKTAVNAATIDYGKLTDPASVPPSAPVHAARLNGLLKTLANAEGAVAESIKARTLLIEGLEKILNTNRTILSKEQEQLSGLSTQRTEIDSKKREVEDVIMKGFGTGSSPATPTEGSPGQSHSPTTPAPEVDRPEVEALTPPAFEPLSPSPAPETQAADVSQPSVETATPSFSSAPGSDLLASLSAGPYGQLPATNGHENGEGSANKRRKINLAYDFPEMGGDDGMDGIDDDVAEILRKDSTGPK